jgi:hypothetical protein
MQQWYHANLMRPNAKKTIGQRNVGVVCARRSDSTSVDARARQPSEKSSTFLFSRE